MASHNRLTVRSGGVREQGYSAGMHLTVDVHPRVFGAEKTHTNRLNLPPKWKEHCGRTAIKLTVLDPKSYDGARRSPTHGAHKY